MLYKPDDRPQWTDERQILTEDQLNIPSLHMIGHACFHTAFRKLATHYHHCMEFVVVLNGKQHYIVDGRHYMLYGGDIFMTYPNENHGNGDTLQEMCEFIWFQLDLSTSRNFLGLPPGYDRYLFSQCMNYQHRTRKADPKELPLLRCAFDLFSSDEPQKRILGYSKFLQFITSSIFTGDAECRKDISSPDIEAAAAYIHAHLTDDISIAQIAENCGLSPSHFKAKFKARLGMTPYAYIVSLKIDTAKILLKDPGNSVTDIAYQLNFSSSNHFSTVFKKHTGFTPTEFRSHPFSDIC